MKATGSLAAKRSRLPRGVGRACFVLGLLLLAAGAGDDVPPPAAENDASLAYLIRLPLPLTGGGDARIKQTVDSVLERVEGREDRTVIVFEFKPVGGEGAEDSEFERSLSLARYLTSDALSEVRTVAYLPQTVEGHAVLVAMACEEIIMDSDASLGNAGMNESSIDTTVRSGYREIADRRRTIPAAVALGMLDEDVSVHRVATATGTQYALGEELQGIEGKQSVDTLVETGDMLSLRADQMRAEGFATHIARDRNEVARTLDLPAGTLEIDPSLGETLKAVRVSLKGPVNPGLTGRAMRALQDGIQREEANFVIIEIDSPGGSLVESMNLANFLIALEDQNIRTVAYVPEQALGDAALVALACDHVVMGADAKLGGSGLSIAGAEDVELLKRNIRQLAQDKSRSWSLIAAMFDANLPVDRYTLEGTRSVGYFSEEELAEQRDADAWEKGDPVTVEGQLLQVDGLEAEEYGLARYLVDDFAELRQVYHLPDDVTPLRPNWAHDFIEALSHPGLAFMLLMIGFFSMVGELMSPGLGAPGFIATVCFVLFFWSQFLHGTAGWLEVLLFVTGLVFLAVEIFVVPGFGVFGVGGICLCLLSLVLASQTFVLPRTKYEFTQLQTSFLLVCAAGMGALAGVIVFRKLMPHTPYFNRMMLAPPENEELAEMQRRESIVDWSHLVDQQGMATTRLAPAGKARIGDQLIDVISDGSLIESGTPIRVVEVQGNHVEVAPLDSTT